jgi:hypothetical protein
LATSFSVIATRHSKPIMIICHVGSFPTIHNSVQANSQSNPIKSNPSDTNCYVSY